MAGGGDEPATARSSHLPMLRAPRWRSGKSRHRQEPGTTPTAVAPIAPRNKDDAQRQRDARREATPLQRQALDVSKSSIKFDGTMQRRKPQKLAFVVRSSICPRATVSRRCGPTQSSLGCELLRVDDNSVAVGNRGQARGLWVWCEEEKIFGQGA